MTRTTNRLTAVMSRWADHATGQPGVVVAIRRQNNTQ